MHGLAHFILRLASVASIAFEIQFDMGILHVGANYDQLRIEITSQLPEAKSRYRSGLVVLRITRRYQSRLQVQEKVNLRIYEMVYS